jgi:hypothetical protein
LTAAASILATEARHDAWIGSAALKSYPWSTPFEVHSEFFYPTVYVAESLWSRLPSPQIKSSPLHRRSSRHVLPGTHPSSRNHSRRSVSQYPTPSLVNPLHFPSKFPRTAATMESPCSQHLSQAQGFSLFHLMTRERLKFRR